MDLIKNLDGRVELFARDAGGMLLHAWQRAPGGLFGPVIDWENANLSTSWTDWESLGAPHPEYHDESGRLVYGMLMSTPIAGRNEDGRLEVFGIAASDPFHADLVHMWQPTPGGGPWSGWASLGGDFKLTAPAVIRNADGRLEVFATARTNELWHIWQTARNNGWSDWDQLGGEVRGAPAVARNVDGRLEVFARRWDDTLWHMWQPAPGAGPWSEWASLGRPRQGVQSAPTVSQNADGRLEVFVTWGQGIGHIAQASITGSAWSSWFEDDLGLGITGQYEGPSLARSSDLRLEVFGLDDDKYARILHTWQTAPSNGWYNSPAGVHMFEGSFTGAPVATANSDGRLEVFARGIDHSLWHSWQTAPNNGWSAWAVIGGGHISDIGKTLWADSDIWGHD